MLPFNLVSDAISKFIDELDRSLATEAFVKLTLSNYRGGEVHLQRIAVRPVETKKGRRLMFQYRYQTRDVAKNYDAPEAIAKVTDLLTSGFRSGHLFTTSGDFQLTIGKKSSRLVTGKPSFTEQPDTAHDRQKTSLVDPSAFYLKALGITTDDGKVRSAQQDKWRQIRKYVEVLRDLFENSPIKEKSQLKIVDMGSGKGYLTFAAYDYFANVRSLNVEMTGVEIRPELVDLGNQIAASGGFDGLKFVSGTISEFYLDNVDILIALHACDTATDDALYKGITSDASIIVAAPCCHKEVRQQIKPPEVLRDILKHGSMMEREAETVTDGLRAMLLEEHGYESRVFEFVPTEHTPKNNLIVGIRSRPGTDRSAATRERIEAVKSFYGIDKQHLENLLA